MTPDGKRIPGLTEKDSIGYRIEALKVYLEQQLSDKIFLAAYKQLQVQSAQLIMVGFRIG